jgi:uncharacterized damage-inducible protein DinB
MSQNIYVRLLEHNNWANYQIIQACSGLSDEQLDAEPQSATMGSIRSTLTHLIRAQNGYLQLLTLPLEVSQPISPAQAEWQSSAIASGEGLLTLAHKDFPSTDAAHLETRDGYLVEPWVVLVQVINHATEHREQVKSMLTALGMTPPDVDGWSYGDAALALFPKSR